jgi:dTDP-4-dehydrorhamnose reductase
MVGQAVVARLAELGLEVTGANRSGAGGGRAFDAANPAGLEPLVSRADLVVNAVGALRSDPDYPGDDYAYRAAQVNTAFPVFLAEAASDHGTRVVHVSTDAVFSPGGEPADEDAPISASEPYGLSKARGEVKAEHVVNIRCSIVGPAPGRRGGLWEWFVTQPEGAEVEGFPTRWTGVTSHQLTMLRDALRPDVRVVEGPGGDRGCELVSRTGALDNVYSGPRGWAAALEAAVPRR